MENTGSNDSNKEGKLLWDEEVDNLSDSNDEYFKPESGSNHIKFLDEGVVYEDEKKYDDDPRLYVKFTVEVDGEEQIWDIAKGTTAGSKFGQIARYAKLKGGLEGEEITWFKQGEGKETNHVLMDLEDDSAMK